MRKHDRRTRGQRKADAAKMGFVIFLALLMIASAYMEVSAR